MKIKSDDIYAMTIDNNDNKLIVDDRGRVWMFDGSRWIIHARPLREYESTNRIVVDSSGNLWMNRLLGLESYNAKKWTSYTHENSGLPSDTVYAIAIDADGNKWIGTQYGVVKNDDNRWTVYPTSNSILPGNLITQIAVDLNNDIWIISCQEPDHPKFQRKVFGKLLKYDGKIWTIYDSAKSCLKNRLISSIAIDSNNTKWFGTSRGLVKYDGKGWMLYDSSNSAFRDNITYTVAIDAAGKKWVGTYRGLWSFDDKKWVAYKSPPHVPEGQWLSIDDKTGDKWLRTCMLPLPRLVLYKFDAGSWTLNGTSDTIIPDKRRIILAMADDMNGNTWFGTYEGLIRWDQTKWTDLTPSNSGLPGYVIRSISVNRNGDVWCGTDAGAAKLSGTDWTSYSVSNSGLPSDNVGIVACDLDGSIWFGTEYGLAKFDDKIK